MTNFSGHILRGFASVLALLPLRVHYVLCAGLAWLARVVVRYRRGVVRTNLSLAFPQKSEEERRDIEKKFYRHLGEVIAEGIWFGGCRSRERLRRKALVTMEDPAAHREEFLAMNGCMVLTSHCGNWELYGGWFAYAPDGSLGYEEPDITVVYKRLSSKAWDYSMRKGRLAPFSAPGEKGCVESRSILRFALTHRDEKRLYVFPNDQYPYKGAAYCTVEDFMGLETRFMTGGAALARKLGMGVMYLGYERMSRGHYRMKFTTICRDASQMTPDEIMGRYSELLQQDLEHQSWNWLWSHKRWKNLYEYKH